MSRGGWRDSFSGLPTPLVVLCAEGMHSTLLLVPTPCFDPGSSEVAVEFFPPSLCIFLGTELAPTVHALSYLQSHTVSLHFVAEGEVCPGASNGSQVPTCLRIAQEVSSQKYCYVVRLGPENENIPRF